MDSSSTSAENSDASREYKAGARQTSSGLRLTLAGLATGIAMFVIGVLISVASFDAREVIAPGRSASIELDDGTYFIYDESLPGAQVEIVGDSGPVELEDPPRDSTVTIDDFHGQVTHSINIEIAGTYDIENNGTSRIAINKPIMGVSAVFILGAIPLGIGTTGIGLVIFAQGQLKRRRAIKRGAVSNGRRHETEVTTIRTQGPD